MQSITLQNAVQALEYLNIKAFDQESETLETSTISTMLESISEALSTLTKARSILEKEVNLYRDSVGA